MDTLIQWFDQFNAYSKANPFVAGAVSLWGLGVVTFMMRSVPLSIWRFAKRQLTTTLQLNSDGRGTNLETFGSLMRWFDNNGHTRWSRTYSLNGVYTGRYEEEDERAGTVLGMGDGTHFFMYKFRPFWLHRRRIEQTGAYNILYEVSITGLGRSRKYLDRMIEEFKYRPPEDKLGTFQFSSTDKCWNRMADISFRALETVIVDAKTKADLLYYLDEFRESREWYARRGLPYKLTTVLHGIPGTGKTSLIRALASHYRMNVCVVNINAMSDSILERALTSVPKNSMIVIEDFDSASATKARRDVPKHEPATPRLSEGNNLTPAPKADKNVEISFDTSWGLTLTGILNALDGIVALDDKVIFLTTNVFDTLDAALVRKGRIDHVFEIKPATHAEVVAYINLMFPDVDTSALPPFADIVGCDLQALYFEYRTDPEGFIQALPKWSGGMHLLDKAVGTN